MAKLLAFMAVLLGIECVRVTAEEVRGIVFASYNVQSYVGEDSSGEPRASKPKSPEAVAAIVRVIQAIRPDVLGICEMGNREQLEDLRRRLAAVGLDLPHAEYVEGPDPDRHLALLSRFPIVARESLGDVAYELNGTLERVKRGFLDVTIRVTPDYEMRAVGAHLKSRLAVREGEALMRRYEAQLLRRHVDGVLTANPQVNLLVYGDLNDSKNTPSIQEVAGLRGSPSHLTDLAPADEQGDRWTHHWKTSDEYSRIDYLFASRGLLPEIAREKTGVHRSPEWNLASDHRPIFTTIVPVNRLR